MIAESRDFTTELQTYAQHEQELQKDLYKWAVIVETKLVGVYDTFEEAVMTEGQKHGLDKIFVREITPVGYQHTITRLLAGF
ncbi:hypothetical protein GC173_11475 [bacterium]|nr:hypothetical protein [bacterium]